MPALNLSGSPTQNFNTLADTGTPAWANDTTLNGWYAARATGGPDFATYTAGTGTANAGALYSFGVAGTNPVSDRALGSVASGTPGTIYYGVRLINDTANPVAALNLTYTGEQWRDGNNTTQHSLNVSYQIGTIGTTFNTLLDGTWTAVPTANFTGPIATTTAGALDGNAAANRATINRTFNLATPLAVGQEIVLRWEDPNDTGNDHGLAIDDVTITTSAPVATAGVTITESGGSTTLAEGGATDTYTIALNTAPTAPVTILVSPGDGQTQVSLDGTTFANSLAVTLANTTAQTITVRAINDTYVEGTHRGAV